jgi:RNA-directed DNA polymerase
MQTIEAILNAGNLTKACQQVIRNKGAAGVDAMSVKELKPFLDKYRNEFTELIRQGEYYPQAIRGKEIPKSNKKKRLLGIPKLLSYYFITVNCRNVFDRTNIRLDSIF